MSEDYAGRQTARAKEPLIRGVSTGLSDMKPPLKPWMNSGWLRLRSSFETEIWKEAKEKGGPALNATREGRGCDRIAQKRPKQGRPLLFASDSDSEEREPIVL
ncbi:hypothetical protein AAFF_G00365030 [Aldrovandia affinis]|uniref:Uncharacterized protein n=1 Tax=Aldrovandia affinis TaxID=143900 RepID=A0AAD7R536_9TELE|nr:hypothetical protein AAFF_G00365030 [Aldrovandia affinis]